MTKSLNDSSGAADEDDKKKSRIEVSVNNDDIESVSIPLTDANREGPRKLKMDDIKERLSFDNIFRYLDKIDLMEQTIRR